MHGHAAVASTEHLGLTPDDDGDDAVAGAHQHLQQPHTTDKAAHSTHSMHDAQHASVLCKV